MFYRIYTSIDRRKYFVATSLRTRADLVWTSMQWELDVLDGMKTSADIPFSVVKLSQSAETCLYCGEDMVENITFTPWCMPSWD